VIGFPGTSIDCAANFVVEGFSGSLALEGAPFGMHLTVVERGFVRTDFLDGRSAGDGAKVPEDYVGSSAETKGGL
jgi:NAD(P)-dependent dehydrogenase (short-subunit alcohol dehydrogenase family)